MSDLRDSRLPPAEFGALLDEAKVRAVVLREQAKREFGASVLAAARRLVRDLHAARNTATRTPGTSFR